MKTKKLFAFLLAGVMLICCLSTFVGCGTNVTPEGSTFRIARVWDRTGIRNHFNSGSNIGALSWLACEPLIQYVRTTDEIYYLLAESVEHNADHTSLIHVRKNAKWHNGEDFTADDVIAYYSLNFTTVSNYLSKMMEKVDTYTVKLTWKTWMEPTDETKTLMLAQDKVGTVQNSVFSRFAETARNILSTQTSCEPGYFGWAPYGKLNSAEADQKYNNNYSQFMNTNPETFCGTGPYKVERITQTQMLLKKNEDHYFADRIPYGNVLCYNISDLSTIYNMLLMGELDYQDGFAPDTTIELITSQNKSMVHLKAYDPASVGILFNLEKPIWTDKVREAFQYLFNRETMKNSANIYAVTSYYPVSGMVSTEAQKFMSKENYDGIPQYVFDEARATALLQEAGWSKNDSAWYDENGKKVSLTLGYDGSNAIMSSLAEAVQGALSVFGIDCKLKRSPDWGTWYQVATAENSYTDFNVNWTELGLSFAHPTGCYKFFFTEQNGPVLHLPKITQEDIDSGDIPGYEKDNVKLRLNKLNGEGQFYAYEYVSRMYSMNDEELYEATADLVYGVGSQNFGVNFFRNVSGGFYNSAVIGNLPLSDLWSSGDRNVTAIPEMYSDDYYALARCSLEFACGIPLLYQYYDAALKND